MKKLNMLLVAVLTMIITGCSGGGGSDPAPLPLSSEKAITAFNFASPAATGVITEATHTIAIIVPFGTAVTALVPTITHTGASISPASGVAQDFTAPVVYTVTAADASTQGYTVTVAVESADYTSPNIGTLKYVPPGSFQRDATPENISVISTAFRMSQHEITRAQFLAVMGTDPSTTTYSTGPSDPVQTVNWYHVIAFCNKLSLLENLTPVYSVTGVDFSTLTFAEIPIDWNETWNAVTAEWSANGYRLPTEMEWMWAAMGATSALGYTAPTYLTGIAKPFAGSNATNAAGDNGSNAIENYAWFGDGWVGTTHPVGTKLPNELDLYDMSGNVMEWCWDGYDDYPAGELTDYRGEASGTFRVDRGGNWFHNASMVSVAYREWGSPHGRSFWTGFRVVRP